VVNLPEYLFISIIFENSLAVRRGGAASAYEQLGGVLAVPGAQVTTAFC